jgi:hypothetical protein
VTGGLSMDHGGKPLKNTRGTRDETGVMSSLYTYARRREGPTWDMGMHETWTRRSWGWARTSA